MARVGVEEILHAQLFLAHGDGGEEAERTQSQYSVDTHCCTPSLMVTFKALPCSTLAGTVMSSITGPAGIPEIT